MSQAELTPAGSFIDEGAVMTAVSNGDAPAVTTLASAEQGALAEIELVGRRVRRSATAPVLLRAQLRGNLRDPSARFLLAALLCAQVADLVSTRIALARPGLWERNPFFRMLFASPPGVADAVKLGAVLLIASLALAALPMRRAQHALLFAAGISLVAPIANIMTLMGHL